MKRSHVHRENYRSCDEKVIWCPKLSKRRRELEILPIFGRHILVLPTTDFDVPQRVVQGPLRAVGSAAPRV